MKEMIIFCKTSSDETRIKYNWASHQLFYRWSAVPHVQKKNSEFYNNKKTESSPETFMFHSSYTFRLIQIPQFVHPASPTKPHKSLTWITYQYFFQMLSLLFHISKYIYKLNLNIFLNPTDPSQWTAWRPCTGARRSSTRSPWSAKNNN